MGKKNKGGLSGISRFVLESMKSTPTDANVQDDPSKTATTTVTSSLTSSSYSGAQQTPIPSPEKQNPEDQNLTRKSAKRNEDEEPENLNHPAKKRKANDGSAVVQVQEFTSTQRESADEPSGWISRYDASGLVPHYTNASQVPEHLKKYFSQRYRYFSLYSTSPGCLLDEEGWYSVTPESVATHIAERCRCDTVLDAFCGVGGNAIAFARTCQRVIALDTSPTRLALARHNAQIYGVADRIEFILSDYISFVKSFLSLPKPKPLQAQENGSRDTKSPLPSSNHNHNTRKIDVIFLSPPWGGPSYLDGTGSTSLEDSLDGTSPSKSKENTSTPGTPTPTPTHPSYTLSSIQPIHGAELFDLSRKITKNIAYFLPRNTRLEEISDLLVREEERARKRQGQVVPPLDSDEGRSGEKEKEEEHVEVEEEWMGNKLKALTCYFGGLVVGQEEMF